MVGRKGTVNHWSSKSQEASAQGKKRVLENGLRPREAPWFPSVYQSSRKAAAITALNSYVHRRESQAVSTQEGVISPGAEFYHHHRTGGLCTFSLLPCTWPMRHLYLLIPVGSEEGRTSWKTDDEAAGTRVRNTMRQLTHS